MISNEKFRGFVEDIKTAINSVRNGQGNSLKWTLIIQEIDRLADKLK